MKMSQSLRAGLIALIAIVGASFASTAWADSGTIRITIIKGGFFVGASGGSGTLTFHGKTYALDVGGISAGLVFGAAKANLSGRVRNISRASDAAGAYGAAGAGAAATSGSGVIVLTNTKGAVLELKGSQSGLMLNVDLSGMVISLK